jgi:hypothetical protein
MAGGPAPQQHRANASKNAPSHAFYEADD